MTTTAIELIPSRAIRAPRHKAAAGPSLACVFVACLLEQDVDSVVDADFVDGCDGANRRMPSGDPYGLQIYDVTINDTAWSDGDGDRTLKWMARRGGAYVIADIHYPSYCDDECDGWIQNVTETLTRSQALRHLRAAIAEEKAELDARIKRIKKMASDLSDALKADEDAAIQLAA